jgi:hypothetical protein
MWSVTNEGIKACLVQNNVFGWLGIGFADPDGGHNGMDRGQILLTSPYDTENYSPVTGLDNSTDAIGTYMIDVNDTAFGHWSTQLKLMQPWPQLLMLKAMNVSLLSPLKALISTEMNSTSAGWMR